MARFSNSRSLVKFEIARFFEPQISVVGSDRSTNSAPSIDLPCFSQLCAPENDVDEWICNVLLVNLRQSIYTIWFIVKCKKKCASVTCWNRTKRTGLWSAARFKPEVHPRSKLIKCYEEEEHQLIIRYFGRWPYTKIFHRQDFSKKYLKH